MAKKKVIEEGAASAAPNEAAQKVMPRDLLERAVPGDRQGLARAFGHAGGWLRAGEAPPPELAAWVGERLIGLANVLNNPRVKKDLEGEAARALGLVERGKRGRKADSEHDLALKRFIVWDCHYQRRLHPELTWEQVFERVAKVPASAGVHLSVAKIEAAWKKRRELVPEIPELNP